MTREEFQRDFVAPLARGWDAFVNAVKWCWFHLPLVGETEGTSLRDWSNAGKQFIFIWLFSILPPLIAWFAASLDVHSSEPAAFGIAEVLKPSEIVVSSLAFIAPVVWMACEHLIRGRRLEITHPLAY